MAMIMTAVEILGILLVAGGIGWWSPPAGVIFLGLAMILVSQTTVIKQE